MTIKTSSQLTITDLNDGNGIASSVVTYKNHTNGTTAPTGTWSTTIPTPVKGQYLWTRTITTYTDTSDITTYSVSYTATDGQNGSDGKGISSTVIHYQLSTSGTTTPTGTWLTSVPTPVKGQYLWTRTVINYTSGSPSTSYSTSYYATDGQKGDKGADGVSITSVDVYYAQNSSSTTAPTTGWSTTAPTWVNGQYMWSKTITTFSSGSPKESLPVCITGQKGATGGAGATGTGITSITEEYNLSTSKTTANGTWTTTAPTWSSGKYIWTRSKIVYSNPTSTKYTTEICDNSWEAVNEIEVGGRNLLKESLFNSDLDSSYWFGSGGYSVSIDGTEKYNDTNSLKITTTQVGSAGAVRLNFKTLVPMELSSKYTFSFYAKALENATFTTRTGYGEDSDSSLITTEWKKHTMTFTTGATTYPTILPYYDKVTTLWIAFPKLEKGNKATDWTPAPEDIQADIDDKANQSDLNAVEEKVGDLTGVINNKADKDVLQTLQDSYDLRMQKLAESEEQTATDIKTLKDRTSAIDLELGAKKVNWDFITNNIQFGEEGIFLTTKYVLSTDAEGNEIAVPVDGNTETGVLITKDKIAFIDGGEEIASITGQVMKINHGIFVQSAQIGKHKIETLPDSDITVVTFVG